MNARFYLIALILLFLFVPGPLPAQEPESKPTAGDEAAASFAAGARMQIEQIEALLATINRIGPEASAAEGENRLILHHRLIEKKLRALESSNALAELVAAREEAGGDVTAEKERAAALLTKATPLIEQHVEAVEKNISTIAKDPTLLSGSERGDLERQLEIEADRLLSTYRMQFANAEHLDLLGLPSEKTRALLSQKLTDRAENLIARIQLATAEVQALKTRLATQPEGAEVKARLLAAQQRLHDSTNWLRDLLSLMNEVGLDTSAHQTLLVQQTGQITEGLLDARVAVTLIDQWVAAFRSWISKNGPGWLVRFFLFLVILALARIAARIVRRLVTRAAGSSRFHISQLLQRMIVNTATQAVWILGILIALAQLGISLAPLLAGLGIAGFIIGFALQDTLSNFASGMMILLYRPYDVGDAIEAGGVFGKVHRMNLVSTTILTLDNQTLVVPNGRIWGDVIKNVTDQTRRRVDLTFGISYQDDIPKAEQLFEKILANHPKVLDDPEPMVRLHNLGESSVDFIVRPWVATSDYWDVYWDITRAVKIRCDEEGISIPFPQRDVHLYTERSAPEGTAEGS